MTERRWSRKSLMNRVIEYGVIASLALLFVLVMLPADEVGGCTNPIQLDPYVARNRPVSTLCTLHVFFFFLSRLCFQMMQLVPPLLLGRGRLQRARAGQGAREAPRERAAVDDSPRGGEVRALPRAALPPHHAAAGRYRQGGARHRGRGLHRIAHRQVRCARVSLLVLGDAQSMEQQHAHTRPRVTRHTTSRLFARFPVPVSPSLV
jgi:hypothetical protein